MCYFSATLALLGVCGAEVLDKLCSFLCFPFSCCVLFMAALGFPWHGPRLLQTASTAAIIDLHWRGKEWNHRKTELCIGMVTSKIRHVVGQSTGRHLSSVLSGSCLRWFLSLFLPERDWGILVLSLVLVPWCLTTGVGAAVRCKVSTELWAGAGGLICTSQACNSGLLHSKREGLLRASAIAPTGHSLNSLFSHLRFWLGVFLDIGIPVGCLVGFFGLFFFLSEPNHQTCSNRSSRRNLFSFLLSSICT